MKKIIGCLIISAFTAAFAFSQEALQTVAEKSGFTETSLLKDVAEFMDTVQKRSPHMRREIIATSPEGHEIDMFIIGNPPPSSPRDLRLDSRMVVYIQANIHAGEVEGKEAVMMLMRDLFLKENPEFLDRLILLIVPVFNPDGNDKLGRNRRDNGPELAGVRYNGQNLDLNRDGIKMESPEVTGLITRVLNRWDPVLFVDCHTTNGSFHEEPVTYAWPLNPNGDMELIRYMRETMMPAVRDHLKNQHGVLSIPYGNFMDPVEPEKGWRPAGPEARYLTNYVGLRNRFSILLENYAYANFKTRVWGNYYFLMSVLAYCHTHHEEIKAMAAAADARTTSRVLNGADTDSFGLEFELKTLDEPIEILGYETKVLTDEEGRRRVHRTGIRRTYTVPLYYDYQPVRSIPFRAGYFLPGTISNVIGKLKDHGILVERLDDSLSVEVESFRVSKIENSGRLYQGHYMNTRVEGEWTREVRTFPKGTFFITMAQPLADLAVYMLEPECPDGLLVWNYFDSFLALQWGRGELTVPVFRALEKPSIRKTVF